MSGIFTDEDRKRLDFQLTAPADDPDLAFAPDWYFGDDEAEESSRGAFEELGG